MKDKKLFLSVLFAMIIFIMGFGIMNIFWVFSSNTEGLQGLYDYKAATIGDGICFPILVGTLLYSVEKNNILNKRQHMLCNIFGFLMACLGTLMQISWLKDDNIILNWTIPYKHHFNAAGWYHAFFFVLMFGVLGILLSKFYLIRIVSQNIEYEIGSENKISCFLIWFSGSFFLFLHIFDDYKEKYNIVILLQLSALVIFIFAIFLNGITVKKMIMEEIISVFSAVLSALGLSLSISGNIGGLSILAITSFFWAFAYVFQSGSDIITVIVNGVFISVPAFSLNLALSVLGKKIVMAPVFVLAIIAPYIIAQMQKKNMSKERCKEVNKYIFDGVVLGLMLSTTIILFEIYIDNLESITGYISLIVELVVATLAKSSVEKNFECLKHIEDKRKDLKEVSEYTKKLMAHKVVSYFLIVMVGIGAFLYLILMLSSYVELKPFWNIDDFVLQYEEIIMLSVFLVVLLMMLFTKNISNREVKRRYAILSFLLFSIGYILLAVIIYYLRKPFVFDSNITTCFSAFMILGSSFMVTESFYSNLIGIRGIQRKPYIMVASGIIFIGNVLTISIALLPAADLQGNRSSDLIYVLVSVIGCLISTLLMPILIGKIVQCRIPDLQIAMTSPLGGIAQNGFLIWFLVLLGGVTPVYFSAISKDNIYMICGVISIIFSIYWPLSYCIHNNVEHLQKRIGEYSNYDEQADKDMVYSQLKRLAKHLKRQNIATFIALLCYCLVPLGFELANEMRTTGQVKGILKKYIPDTNIDRF